MKKILLLAPEESGTLFSGPSRRISQLQELLCSQFTVVVSSSCPSYPELNEYDFIYVNAGFFPRFAEIKKTRAYLIIDLYVPFFFEHIVRYGKKSEKEFSERLAIDRAIIFDVLQSGDIFLGASERQIDLYMGMLYLFREAEDLKLPLLLPFFMQQKENRGVMEKKTHEAPVSFRIAWIGGFWEWFEPEPFLSIIPRLLSDYEGLEIMFVGLEHPFHRELTVGSEDLQKVGELADSFPGRIKVYPWLSYDEYLRELGRVDLAVVLHKDTLEAVYSMRTRFLELLENGIPVFCSAGGAFADRLQDCGMGRIIENNSAEILYKEINSYMKDPGQLSFAYKSFVSFYKFSDLQDRLMAALHNCGESPARYRRKKRKNPYLKIHLSFFYYFYYRCRRKFFKLMGRIL